MNKLIGRPSLGRSPAKLAGFRLWTLLEFGRGLLFTLLLAGPAFASSFTLPSSTTAYTANQLMANSATGASVVVPSFSIQSLSATEAIISRGRLHINDTTASSWNGQTITIDLFTSAPTFTNGDRSTFSPTTGTASHLASFTCTMSSIYGDGVWGECAIGTGQYLVVPAASPTPIYWTATATSGSGTTGASKVVTFSPEVLH